MNKKGWKTAEKKGFDQLMSARSTQKLVEIHNNGGNEDRIVFTIEIQSIPS